MTIVEVTTIEGKDGLLHKTVFCKGTTFFTEKEKEFAESVSKLVKELIRSREPEKQQKEEA